MIYDEIEGCKDNIAELMGVFFADSVFGKILGKRDKKLFREAIDKVIAGGLDLAINEDVDYTGNDADRLRRQHIRKEIGENLRRLASMISDQSSIDHRNDRNRRCDACLGTIEDQ